MSSCHATPPVNNLQQRDGGRRGFLVVEAAFADHHVLDALAVTVLLLEGDEHLVELLGPIPGDVVQGVPEGGVA